MALKTLAGTALPRGRGSWWTAVLVFCVALIISIGSSEELAECEEGQDCGGGAATAVARLGGRPGIVYMGLLDGTLMAVDLVQGETLWSVQLSGALFSSAGQTLQEEDGGVMVPGLDGSVFSLQTEKGVLTKQSYTVRDLLTHGLKAANGTIVTGSIRNDIYALNPMTGDLQYARLDQAEGSYQAEGSDIEDDDGETLIVAINTQSVRGIRYKTGAESWNFSIGSFDLVLRGAEKDSADPADPAEEDARAVLVLQHGDVAAAVDADSQVCFRCPLARVDSPVPIA